MGKRSTRILTEVAEYYSAKLSRFGNTAQGVDWNSVESQILRFKQLSSLIQCGGGFSVNDLGCGYGALYDYLNEHYPGVRYSGFDVSADMIKAARLLHVNDSEPCFHIAAEPTSVADYGIASGIFNVRLQRSNDEWLDYIKETLKILNRTSRFGFSFNCLTSYSDADKMKEYLYYANPCIIFDFCKRRFSRHVALLHDYGLYEFTVLVRKEP